MHIKKGSSFYTLTYSFVVVEFELLTLVTGQTSLRVVIMMDEIYTTWDQTALSIDECTKLAFYAVVVEAITTCVAAR